MKHVSALVIVFFISLASAHSQVQTIKQPEMDNVSAENFKLIQEAGNDLDKSVAKLILGTVLTTAGTAIGSSLIARGNEVDRNGNVTKDRRRDGYFVTGIGAGLGMAITITGFTDLRKASRKLRSLTISNK